MTIEQEIQAANQKAAALKAVIDRLPDATICVDRWGTRRFSSASVNPLVNDVEIRHSCGCCGDSALWVYPFATVDGKRICSSPERFTVGENNYWNGDTPHGGWEAKMREAGIPEAVIGKVSAWFESHKPREDEDDATEDGGASDA